MGLFDGYQFNPQSYAPGGGLLDLIRQVQQQPQVTPSQGFDNAPSGFQSVGNYQMPVFGQAPAPDPAAMPMNAQPAQGMLPQSETPGIGDRLLAGLQGFSAGGVASGGGLIPALTGGISGLVNGSAPANQTQQALIQRGFDPALAKQVASDPSLLRAVLPSLMGGGQTDDIKEFEYARRNGFQGTLQDWMDRKRGGAGAFSLTPVYGQNEKGETILLQTGKDGKAIQTQLPPGVKVSSGIEKVDLGTKWGFMDKRTGALIREEPKDLRGAAKEKTIGDAQGEAAAKIPAALVDAESTSKKIDQLLATPGLDSIVGGFDQFRPSWTLGESGRDALARLEQLQGGAFLQAFNTLKGGGAITEAEGRKAEQAIARMQRSQSEAQFRIALQDFRDAVNDGIKKLRLSAGETGSYPAGIANAQPAAPAASATPSVDDLLKKYR